MVNQRVAIVGGGVSGTFLAHLLQQRENLSVSLFEKSRGLGGRCAVRRHPSYGSFNLGAQFFTHKNDDLKDFFGDLSARNLIKPFPKPLGYWRDGSFTAASSVTRFVGAPAMNSFPKYWADGASVFLETRIEKIARQDSGWCLWDHSEKAYSGYDLCVLSMPYPQAVPLWNSMSNLSLPHVEMRPCWTLMLVTAPVELKWEAAFIHDADLSWYSSEALNKGGRSWSIHASADWSQRHIDLDVKSVKKLLLGQLEGVLRKKLKVNYSDLHRWRYASNSGDSRVKCHYDSHAHVASIGDWCVGGRVEGAMTSAFELNRILSEENFFKD